MLSCLSKLLEKEVGAGRKFDLEMVFKMARIAQNRDDWRTLVKGPRLLETDSSVLNHDSIPSYIGKAVDLLHKGKCYTMQPHNDIMLCDRIYVT